jgi:hypothetical protein
MPFCGLVWSLVWSLAVSSQMRAAVPPSSAISTGQSLLAQAYSSPTRCRYCRGHHFLDEHELCEEFFGGIQVGRAPVMTWWS